jgi:hypothetical protein
MGGAGSVLNAASDRALIPLVPSMIETHLTHGEYGMSGGPVTTADAAHFLGVLSHQYLKPKAGGHDEVEEFAVPEVSEDHLLVIPAAVAARWVRAVLGASPPAPSAFRDPFAEAHGKTDVITHGLRFSFTRPKPVAVAPNGGGDGVGIGGGDGVGIGGDGETAMRGAGTVDIALAEDAAPTSWTFAPEREAWLARVRQLLLRRAHVTVSLFVERLPARAGMRKHAVTSLAEFFSELLRDEWRPLLHLESGLSGASGVEIDQALRKDGTKLRQLAAKLRVEDNSAAALSARELLEQVKTLASLAESGESELIEASWLGDLREGYRPGWTYLFNASYNETVDLLTVLIRIQDGIPISRPAHLPSRS